MNSLLRLVWALPLSLGIGAGIMLALRRLLIARTEGERAAHRLLIREQLTLSDQTRVHLLEIDGGHYLVVESTLTATLHPMTSQAREGVRTPHRTRPAWLQYLPRVSS